MGNKRASFVLSADYWLYQVVLGAIKLLLESSLLVL
jgi:hypothetical protein